jgi:hypothetical protein
MKASWASVLLLSFVMLLVGGKPSFAQGEVPTPEDRRYFPETGHFVSGEFLQTYESIPNPELIYGLPITRAYLDTRKNRIVQYFENARFEYVAENPAELRVQISELGRLMYTPGQSLPTPENFPACRNYPETRKRICYAFLAFFDRHGGVAQFGYPISNFEIQDQRIVQYFQRARLEWHPELPAGDRVQVSDLGRQYFILMEEDPNYREIEEPFDGKKGDNRVQTILGLDVRAYVDQPVLPQSGQVTIAVTVRDQNLIPVTDATITMTVKLPSGEEQRIIFDPTDENGISKYSLKFDNEPLGLADIRVKATYHEIQKKALTSFRIWR